MMKSVVFGVGITFLFLYCTKYHVRARTVQTAEDEKNGTFNYKVTETYWKVFFLQDKYSNRPFTIGKSHFTDLLSGYDLA